MHRLGFTRWSSSQPREFHRESALSKTTAAGWGTERERYTRQSGSAPHAAAGSQECETRTRSNPLAVTSCAPRLPIRRVDLQGRQRCAIDDMTPHGGQARALCRVHMEMSRPGKWTGNTGNKGYQGACIFGGLCLRQDAQLTAQAERVITARRATGGPEEKNISIARSRTAVGRPRLCQCHGERRTAPEGVK